MNIKRILGLMVIGLGISVSSHSFAGWNPFATESAKKQHVKNFPVYNSLRRRCISRQHHREIAFAGSIMHETGHTLGVFHSNTPGCDDSNSLYPYQINFWKFQPYLSVMNYRYVYSGLIDYSDGSRGKNDFNDWANLDFTFFQRDAW